MQGRLTNLKGRLAVQDDRHNGRRYALADVDDDVLFRPARDVARLKQSLCRVGGCRRMSTRLVEA